MRRPSRLLAIGLAAGAVFAAAAVAMTNRQSPQTPAPPLSVHAEPSSHTVIAGGSAEFAVQVRRHRAGPIGLAGRTRLSVGHDLPAGATVAFTSNRGLAPATAPRHTTTLTVTTAPGTPPGTYELRVRADRPHRSGATAISLVVSNPSVPSPTVAPSASPIPVTPVAAPDAFTVNGSFAGLLAPGAEQPLDLSLSNRESSDLSITSLVVAVAGASGPQSGPAHPCGAGDFAIEQFSGAPGFTLAASSTASLSELGFAEAEWPRVEMLNRPVNQDGCKQATLTLSFAGTATRTTP